MTKINNQFRGIFISGSFLFLLVFFAFLHVSKIIIPVKPPEITPPTPRIFVKLRRFNFKVRRYIINGTTDVSRKFILELNFKSSLNVSFSANDNAMYEVSIVNIPRIIINGPKERVATSVILFPRTPINIALNII